MRPVLFRPWPIVLMAAAAAAVTLPQSLLPLLAEPSTNGLQGPDAQGSFERHSLGAHGVLAETIWIKPGGAAVWASRYPDQKAATVETGTWSTVAASGAVPPRLVLRLNMRDGQAVSHPATTKFLLDDTQIVPVSCDPDLPCGPTQAFDKKD